MLEQCSLGVSFARGVVSSVPRNWLQLNHGLDDHRATNDGIGRAAASPEDREAPAPVRIAIGRVLRTAARGRREPMKRRWGAGSSTETSVPSARGSTIRTIVSRDIEGSKGEGRDLN
jgi:hypothetical protein